MPRPAGLQAAPRRATHGLRCPVVGGQLGTVPSATGRFHVGNGRAVITPGVLTTQRRLPTPRALSRSQAFGVYVVPESTAGTVRSQEALSFQEAPLHHPSLTCQAFAPRNLSEAAASRPLCSRDQQASPGPARLYEQNCALRGLSSHPVLQLPEARPAPWPGLGHRLLLICVSSHTNHTHTHTRMHTQPGDAELS